MCGVDLVSNQHYSGAGMHNNPIQYHHTGKLLEIIANYCNMTDPQSKKKKILLLTLYQYLAFLENSLSNQNVPSPHMIHVCMSFVAVMIKLH